MKRTFPLSVGLEALKDMLANSPIQYTEKIRQHFIFRLKTSINPDWLYLHPHANKAELDRLEYFCTDTCDTWLDALGYKQFDDHWIYVGYPAQTSILL